MANRSFSTEEVMTAYERGVLKDRTVIYHRYQSRREAITVKELVARVRSKADADVDD